MEVLKPLNATGRSRVLEYVLKRLEMDAVPSISSIGFEHAVAPSQDSAGPFVKDIRSLTAEKQPRSANEMVALIAYYLSEVAPDNTRTSTINVETIRKYFKMAAFPMPRVPKNALTNASAAGYLENVARGEYRLNPVGYNLVVHGLPRSSASAPTDGMRRNVKNKKRRNSRR